MGRSYCRNFGNNIATGEILCVLDGDDLALNQRAEWTMRKLKKCQVCYGSTMLMNAIGERARDLIAGPIDKEKILTPINYQKWLDDLEKGEQIDIYENMISHSSMGYLREIALKYPYSEGKISDLGIDDWELQIRMIRAGITFDYIPDIICAYRVHDSGISKTRNLLEVIKLKAEILTGVKLNA